MMRNSAMEIWKSITGYDNLYEVSNLGRVKSLKRVPNTILKPSSNGRYLQLVLHKDGSKSKKYIHRLVAEAFISNPYGFSEVNHKDEDKTNNNVSNLEWCDSTYNNTYNQRHIKSRESLKKPIIVRDISGEIIAEYSSISQASIALNMDKSNISKCCRGVMCSYKSLTFSYK
jgi:hypothetical protein